MDIQSLIRTLERWGAGDLRHGDRTLLDHLRGVYELLRDWDADEAVAVGGLFHSIYGTPAYGRRLVEDEQRPDVRRLIGVRAESLAHLFGSLDQAAVVKAVTSSGSPTAYDRRAGARIELTAFQRTGLAQIGAANLLEQAPHLHRVDPGLDLGPAAAAWSRAEELLPAAAVRGLRGILPPSLPAARLAT